MQGRDGTDVVEEETAFFVGGINAKEDGGLLVVDAGRHVFFRTEISGWKELKDPPPICSLFFRLSPSGITAKQEIQAWCPRSRQSLG